jgi:hypothetical protein
MTLKLTPRLKARSQWLAELAFGFFITEEEREKWEKD